MLSTEQGTSGQSRRAGNIPAGQHRSLHGHFVPPHCNPEADRWAPLSSSAPGKTLMNFKNGWREHVKPPQHCLEAWTVAQEEFISKDRREDHFTDARRALADSEILRHYQGEGPCIER